jgi:transcriptional regulator with XRE-family HTH domain
MYIGIVIREVRKFRGLTQMELSDETNISVRTIQRIETDAVEPSLYSLRRIGEILNIDFLKIKNKNSMAYVEKLLGININENSMTEQEKVSIEERLMKIESHLISIDRIHRKNRRTINGVLYATGIITFSILVIWIIWMMVNI